MAKTKLKLTDATEKDLAACHRLSPDANSGIIARFLDLSARDRWLKNARNLAKLKLPKDKSISIAVDLPPCLRKVKKQLVGLRSNMPDDARKRAYIKHLPSWPYLELCHKVGDKDSRQITHVTKHTFSKSEIALEAVRGLDSMEYHLSAPAD